MGPLLTQKSEGNCKGKSREPWGLSRDCENSMELKGPVSSIVSTPLHLQRVGQRLYPGALACMQGLYSLMDIEKKLTAVREEEFGVWVRRVKGSSKEKRLMDTDNSKVIAIGKGEVGGSRRE